MKIQVSLPMPKTAKTDIGITELVPIASRPEDAWYNQANISENHIDCLETKGRQLTKNGILNRQHAVVVACGLSARDILKRAGVGKGSRQAKELGS